MARVYPRVCGGTMQWPALDVRVFGLSPRVRGNRQWSGYASGLSPRVRGNLCGPDVSVEAHPWRGLSPRVRGNQLGARPYVSHEVYPRVCGGTPSYVPPAADARTVYPRVCGGTISARAGDEWPSKGLSPRVRGNQRIGCWRIRRKTGLSPRVRGNPVPGRFQMNPCSLGSRVYPRVCGGTPKRSLLVSTSAMELPLNCTSPGRSRQHRLSPSAPLPIPEFAGRLPPMAPSRSLLSIPAASRHTTQPILSRPSPVCLLSCLATCIRRALSPTLPRPENLDNALRH